MLSKPHRIRKQKEFDQIFKYHKKVNSENFQLLIHFVDSVSKRNHTKIQKYPKFGFIVSSKIGNAVERNRVKRLLREIVRLELANLKPTFDALIIAFPQIVNKDFQTLQEELKLQLKKTVLFK